MQSSRQTAQVTSLKRLPSLEYTYTSSHFKWIKLKACEEHKSLGEAIPQDKLFPELTGFSEEDNEISRRDRDSLQNFIGEQRRTASSPFANHILMLPDLIVQF